LAAVPPKPTAEPWVFARDTDRYFIGLRSARTLICMMLSVTDRAPLIILTAVVTEARAVARALRIATPAVNRPSSLDRLRPLELHLIGIGARHLPTGLDRAAGIILAGLAGGLDPAFHVGDVIIDGWKGPPIASARAGQIACSRQIVGTPLEKAELFRQTGAAAVDMESDAVRQAAGNVPFVHLRAISDAADDAIDAEIVNWVDAVGRPRPRALAMGLLARPMRAAYLARLGLNVRIATRALEAAVPTVVEAFDSSL
jgi:adenosylhomocysteine nucleosidase